MANKIQHLRSSVAGRVPTAGQLAAGEIAINTADNILYTKNDAGQVIRVGTGTYTKSEMDAKFLPQGILPITRIGDLSSNPLPINLSNQSLVVTAAIPVILSGRQFSVAAATYTFNDIVLNGSTVGSVYCYVGLAGGQAVLEFSLAAQPESVTRVFIGTVSVALGGATSNMNVNKVSRLDIYRPSVNPIGSAFPVSTGTPDTTGSTNW